MTREEVRVGVLVVVRVCKGVVDYRRRGGKICFVRGGGVFLSKESFVS